MPVLSVGISQLAAKIFTKSPIFIIKKFVGLICQNAKALVFSDAMADFNAVVCIYGITDSVSLAISMTFLQTASF